MRVIETQEFIKTSKKIITLEQKNEILKEICSNPETGKVIPGTGGLRKVRVALNNKGKRGGGRVIYYYLKIEDTIILITLYAKNEKEDISESTKKLYRELIKSIESEVQNGQKKYE